MSKPTDVHSTQSDNLKWYSDRKCPDCGKFVSNATIICNGLDEVVEHTGICKTHGKVAIDYEFA